MSENFFKDFSSEKCSIQFSLSWRVSNYHNQDTDLVPSPKKNLPHADAPSSIPDPWHLLGSFHSLLVTFQNVICVCLVAQSCPTLRCHGLWPVRPLCPWNSPGRATGMHSHSLLQGIFPRLRDWIPVSCIEGGFYTIWATREAQNVI